EIMLTVYEGGQFRTINRLDGRSLGTPVAITEDRDENVWVTVGVASPDRKLFRIRDQRVQEEIGPDRVPLVRHLAADPTGGIWLGLENGNLGHYSRGTLEVYPLQPHADASEAPAAASRTIFTSDEIRFPNLMIDADGSAWVSTWHGLVRWKNREIRTLTSRNG